MIDPTPVIPLPLVFDTTQHRLTRELSQKTSKLLNILIFKSTVPLPFETFPEDNYTTPLIREHHDSNLCYIVKQSVMETPDEPPFSIPITSPLNHSDIFR